MHTSGLKAAIQEGPDLPYCIQVSSGITVIPQGSSSSCSAPDFTGFIKQPLEVIPQRLLPQTPRRPGEEGKTYRLYNLFTAHLASELCRPGKESSQTPASTGPAFVEEVAEERTL